MIYFHNPGEIDIRCVKTFGVNVKDNTNPIGHFGTGLKYAIAIILRLGGSIAIHVGEEKHTFSLSPQEIRGKTFNFVTMDGEPLGFTTEVGKNWEPWQALRELLCNALDEGGGATAKLVDPIPGNTLITVSCAEVEEAFYNRDEYFIATHPLHELHGVEAHAGRGNGAFYRGVRVGEFEHKAMFRYNFTNSIALTEDRTVRWPHTLLDIIRRAVLNSNDPLFIAAFVTAPNGSLEQQLDINSSALSETFARVMKEMNWKNITNKSAIRAYKKYSLENFGPTPCTLMLIEQKQLVRAQQFLQQLGLVDTDTFPVVVTEDMEDHALGLAWEQKIYIARRTFMMGTKMVASTILEEYIHLEKRLYDETRELQNYLFDLVASLGEQIVGEPL